MQNGRIAELLSSGNFVEGEAIAIVRPHADVEAAPQAEGLAEVSSDAVEGAIQTEGVVSEEAAMRTRSVQDETFDVKLVVDHGRTTEQILRDLYADPDVISAEPNYITTEREAFGDNYAAAGQEGSALAAGDVQGSSLSTQDTTSNQGDLTPLQWPMDDSLSTADNANTPIVKPNKTGYSLNVPGWKEGRTNESADPNASGVVCVMDEGIDPTHPDLKDVLYKFSPEQQAKYHCGEYGYNASGDPYGTNYLRPCGNHGTHVAGIVAAQWNGTGVSGVAHGVKLISVNAFGGDGRDMHMSALVKGFQFLVDVSKDVNLKVVNCSWGIKQPEFALTVMVNELGKKGVNTVIAAGNDHENLDETIDFGSSTVSSPYAITVDSAMADGKTSEFSSYGQTSTDVFAPGSNFMSTMAQEVTTEVDTKTGVKSGYSKQIHYYPQATAVENRIAFETFADVSGVRVFKDNPAIKADAQEIRPTLDKSNGYGDQCSLAVKLSSLNTEPIDTKYIQGMLSTNGYVYLAIPVESAEAANNVKWASVDVALGDTVDVSKTFKPAGGFDTLTCLTRMKGKDVDEPVEVSAAASAKLDKGWGSASAYTIYQT